MGKDWKWITPFRKQCFVNFGVILSMFLCGSVVGYPTPLLHQLRKPGSAIIIDDSSGSWIAAIMGVAIFPSNFVITALMGKFGRKVAMISSIVTMIIGWLVFVIATDIKTLFTGRFFQGFAMGMCSILSSVLIGEYTTPRNRGVFLAAVSIATASGTMFIHTIGFYLSWQMSALICTSISLLNLLIVFYSPESPSWLVDQERYEESKKVFRWLRGPDEEEELKRMIEATITRKSELDSSTSQSFIMRMTTRWRYCVITMKKREFYIPIIIMIHLHVTLHWSGVHPFSAYAIDVVHNIVGTDYNTSLIIISVGIQRIISSICALYIYKKMKRRTVLFLTVGLNVATYLVTAGYTYAKAHNMLSIDHPSIGIALIHILVFTIATGLVPLPYIIAGELFPLEYRSLATGISAIVLSPNFMIPLKTVPFLFKTIGLHGAYCLYAGIVGYCLLVIGILLPETKDRTLQDIEDELRGKELTTEEVRCVQPLTSG